MELPWNARNVFSGSTGKSGRAQTEHGGIEMVAKGIQFVVDGKGAKSAVVIDLRRHRQVWEDFYDLLIVRSRKAEPRLSWTVVRTRAAAAGRKRA